MDKLFTALWALFVQCGQFFGASYMTLAIWNIDVWGERSGRPEAILFGMFVCGVFVAVAFLGELSNTPQKQEMSALSAASFFFGVIGASITGLISLMFSDSQNHTIVVIGVIIGVAIAEVMYSLRAGYRLASID